MIPVVVQSIILVVLLSLSFCFSGSETALFSLKAHEIKRIQREPSRWSIRVISLLKDPYRLLIGVLVGNTMVNVAASSVGTSIASRFFAERVVGISVTVMSVLILMFGEVIPKTYALNSPVKVSRLLSPVASAAVNLFAGVKVILDLALKIAEALDLAKLRTRRAPAGEHVAEAIAISHSEGVVDRFEREVLGGLFKIGRLSVQNVMTPRTEVFMLSSDLTLGQALHMIKSSRFSRIPVFGAEDRDTIVGVLYMKDLLYAGYSPEMTLGGVARKPIFVPESKGVGDLLKEFVGGVAHFAVAIDEYGTYTGIVTLDDILAEILGRATDRLGDSHVYGRKSKSSWEVSGRMEIDYFNALVGASLPREKAETVAGYMTWKMGKIPTPGEGIVVGNIRLAVVEADPRHVVKIAVERLRKG